MTRILLLGGTREAAQLATQLVEEGHDVTTSLAGRTKEPEPVAGRVRVGGFGGADGLAKWMISEGIEHLIDATHPFAEQISRNAVLAADKTGITLEARTREAWVRQKGDNWIGVDSLEDAANSIPRSARVLLALGSQHLSPFEHRNDVHFLIRMIDRPVEPLNFADHELHLSRPSRDWREEADLLTAHKISHIVSRNSGGMGAYAKIEAARHLALPVIMIDRPRL